VDRRQIVQAVVVNVVKIVVAVVLVMLIYNGALRAYDFGYEIFAEQSAEIAPGRSFEVTVVQGKEVADVAEMLEEYGLIRSAEIYRIREWFAPEQGDMKPGVYTLNTSMYPSEMISILAGQGAEELDVLK
jgi:UPF0755 protein